MTIKHRNPEAITGEELYKRFYGNFCTLDVCGGNVLHRKDIIDILSLLDDDIELFTMGFGCSIFLPNDLATLVSLKNQNAKHYIGKFKPLTEVNEADLNNYVAVISTITVREIKEQLAQ